MNIHKHVLDHYWKCVFTLLILDPGTSNIASSNDVSTIDFIALAPRGEKSQPPNTAPFSIGITAVLGVTYNLLKKSSRTCK